MPPSPVLKKIRAHIDLHGDELENLLSDKLFQKVYGGLSEGPALKTAPKGFPKDHPHIEFLRMKSFTAIKSLNADQMTADEMVQTCVEACEALSPFVHFLNDAMEK